MARTFTLDELATRVRERADMEFDNFISEAEMYRFIDASYTELYDHLLKADPTRYQQEVTFTVGPNSPTYSLPTNYYGTLNVLIEGLNGSTEYYTPVERIQPGELHKWPRTETGSSLYYSYTRRPAFGFRFRTIIDVGSGLYTEVMEILPLPSTTRTFLHVYAHAPRELTLGTDIVDGVSGWEEYIVLDAAIKCLAKEESSTTSLENQLAKMRARIDEMAENRTLDEAGRIADSGHFSRSDFADIYGGY